MVTNLSILSYTVPIFDFNIPIYKFLQHGSTIAGMTLIIVYMYFRTARNKSNRDETTNTKQKLMYWGQIALLTALLFCVWYLIDSVSIDFYGIIVVRIIDSALISLLVVSLYFKHLPRFYFKKG